MWLLLAAIAVVGALFVATGVARRVLAEAEAEKPPAPCCCAPCHHGCRKRS
ncbi:hypothetical protein GCM10010348_78940 [Streptomyces anthocyanicus]|uniref:hypothetical protein n=1 Tax=Streptomyces anthocyanicus TaxID=68174 RepID=UPI001873E5C3|nr:hypothetical protein [Streptomyces anthocyanicus]GHC39798.1 hypothetical protein GCM10010348_78940 [Streptomyces anthocyanicus]